MGTKPCPPTDFFIFKVKPEEFLKKARDPSAWRAKAFSLRRSADVVWDAFSHRLLDAIDKETKSLNEDKLSEATDVLRNCQFLYSLAAECALKGLIIKLHPSDVTFETTVDGMGSLIDAKIKQIGKTRIDTHNLEKLAEISGILGVGGHAERRELLTFSTFCINWIGRYPVPLGTDSDFIPRGKLHAGLFNHYYRDLMDPFLDEVFEELDR
ncbi:hypothetical protein A1353_06335 [Methylomonas methanica]|uniref:Uncharacterized protein n=1 Tax=Methylomonas methanica TaxID=421 RepID=A0A177MSF5_METMH|nr:hypothetical protein A1353_06335 [Methylomonas methanica]